MTRYAMDANMIDAVDLLRVKYTDVSCAYVCMYVYV